MHHRQYPARQFGLTILLLFLLVSTGCVATGFLDYVGKKDQEAETVYDTLDVAQLEFLSEGSTLLLVLKDDSHLKGKYRGLNPYPSVGLQVPNTNPALFNPDQTLWVPMEEISLMVHIDEGRHLRTRAVLVGLAMDTLFWIGVAVLLSGFSAIGYMA